MTDAGSFLAGLRVGLRLCLSREKALTTHYPVQKVKYSVVIGVSGGADSVALLRGLLELRDEFHLSLHVAHLNHQLRGAASDADAVWVEQLCQTHGVPAVIGKCELHRDRAGLEEAAREARHGFLDQAAMQTQCQVIATAHTADDQAETVLHHVVRGTGLSGLRGIPAVRATRSGLTLIRPMLSIRRATIEKYLASIGQDFRTDATNLDTGLTRNWLRHELLPALRTQFGLQVDSGLVRLAEQAAEVEQTLACLAGRLLDQAILDRQPDTVRLNSKVFQDQPLHLVREALRTLWLRQQWPRQGMGFVEWNRLADVALSGGDANLPGHLRARQNPPGLLILEKTNR